MGLHIVPESYLKNFTNEEGKFYCYFSGNKPFLTKPNSVANQNDYYSDDTEKYLANKIEGPTNSVIRKIKSYQDLSNDDKKIMSDYIVTMIKRLPRMKEYYQFNAPEIMKKTTIKTIQKVNQGIIFSQRPKSETIKKLKDLEIEFSNNPPDDVWESLIRPQTTPSLQLALLLMRWTFWIARKTFFYVTSDNPVFYFKEIGLGRTPQSNLTFPIISTILLMAHWSKYFKLGYCFATTSLISEFNLRSIYNSEKSVFSERDENWITKYLQVKRKPNYLIPPYENPIPEFFRLHKEHQDYMVDKEDD